MSVFLAISIVLLSDPVLSSVASELEKLFDEFGRATSSEGGVYESQSRGYIVGGSATVRTSYKYLQPFYIQFPDFKAGCGGIDMFFGGFQFINAEEFKRFLEQAGSAAIGYAFHMALEAVCPTCNSVLKALRQFANEVNKFGLDSCTAAKALTNTVLGPMFDNLKQVEAEKGQTDSGFWDPVKGWLQTMSENLSDIHRQIYEKARRNPVNPVKPSTSTELLKYSTSLSEEEYQIAVSLLGIKTPSKTDTGDYFAYCEDHAPTLTMKDLMEGGSNENPLVFYQCMNGLFSDGSCQEVGTMTDASFKGYRVMVREKLQTIREKVINNVRLDESEVDFLNKIPLVPVLSLLKASSAVSPVLASATVSYVSDAAAAAYALYVVDTYVTLYRRAATREVCGDVPVERIRNVEESLFREYAKYMETLKGMDSLIAFINALQRTTAQNMTGKLMNALKNLEWK